MAKEDEWLRAPKLGLWLMGTTLSGFVLMILAASFSEAAPYLALVGGAMVSASVLAVATTAFTLSRRQDSGSERKFSWPGRLLFAGSSSLRREHSHDRRTPNYRMQPTACFAGGG